MAKEWNGERLETFVHNEATVEHLHRYTVVQQYIRDKDVADIACGEGYGANLLAAHARSVIGIDIDKPTVTRASATYKRGNLRFLQGDVREIPLAAHSMDVVVCLETIEHIAEQEQALREIKRILRPEGVLFISTPDKENFNALGNDANPYHVKELDEETFTKLLGQFFSDIRVCYQRSSFASVVTGGSQQPLQLYKGDFTATEMLQRLEPVYLLAIASDRPVAELSSSVFIGEAIFQQALREKEAGLKRTASYRLGHALLFPFKLLRKLLIKNT